VAAIITIAALNILNIMVAALAGVVLLVITGCLDAEDLQTAVSWDIIFLLAGVIPLGIAMSKEDPELGMSTAEIIAELLASWGNFLPPIMLLIVIYLLTTMLTEVISNNASVVLIVPLAVSIAVKTNLNPEAFVLAVMFAASTSFLTPIGYQTNTMVYGAGNYKFSDFIKVGGPLNLLLAIITPLLIAHFWGLYL
jgi:di/tricarboxylate transporter